MVVGLGNPGREYENTPHNVGFEVVDALAGQIGTSLRRGFRFHARMGSARWEQEDVLLVKPLAFMNRSGGVVADLARYRRLEPCDLIVVLDDVHLEIGRIRIRGQGSSGGHKGLESIIEALGTPAFPRIRIGVGEAAGGGNRVDHVLTPFAASEVPVIRQGIDRAAEAVRVMIGQGVEAAMNRFNGPAADGAGPGEKQRGKSETSERGTP